eukprot:scaffold33481_cov61-Phaeocystis_antarctica.AAC.4
MTPPRSESADMPPSPRACGASSKSASASKKLAQQLRLARIVRQLDAQVAHRQERLGHQQALEVLSVGLCACGHAICTAGRQQNRVRPWTPADTCQRPSLVWPLIASTDSLRHCVNP